MPFRKKQDVYCLFSECFPRILVCNMWVSTKRIYYLVHMFKCWCFCVKWFLSQIGPWSFQIHSFGSSDFDGFVGMIFDGSPPPPKKKKHETDQIFRIFLLDLKWLWLFSVVFGESRIVPLWGDDFEESGSWVTWHRLAMGPHDMADRAKAEQVDGQFFGNPVPQAMNHVNHWGILCAICIICGTGRSWIFSCWFFFFRTTLGHHNQELLGFFRILTGFDRSKATCSNFFAVSCLFWRACFCQHHGFTAPCFHF